MATTSPPTTERLKFRRFRETDASAVAEMFSDPLARRWYPAMADRQAALGWIRWNLESYRTSGVGLWVIEDRLTSTFLGDCGLVYQPVEDQQLLEIGYHLHARYRGRGYATEAARSCLAYGFDVIGAELVCSIVDPENKASIRVAANLHYSQRTFVNVQGKTMNLYWTEASDR